MNIFGIGLPEIAVIGALALIIFGPKRLPELGRTLGKTLKGLQVASNEFEREVQKAMTVEAVDDNDVKKIDSAEENENEIEFKDMNKVNNG